MTVPHALRYSLQGEGWLQRLLLLSVLQLLPLVGQSILIGYGMEVSRSVYAGQSGLPLLRPLRAAGDGLRLLVAGLLYAAPVFLMVPMILTMGTTQAGSTSDTGFPMIFVSLIVAVVVAPAMSKLPAKLKWLKQIVGVLIFTVPVFMVVSMIASMVNNPSILDIRNIQLNTVGMVLGVVLGVLAAVVVVGLHIGGLRYAIQGKGLLDPTGSWQLVRQHRGATGTLFVNVLLLLVIGGAMTALGLPFILPAAVSLVVTTIAIWYTLAGYGRQMGLITAATSR
jgi:hypothetical protein